MQFSMQISAEGSSSPPSAFRKNIDCNLYEPTEHPDPIRVLAA